VLLDLLLSFRSFLMLIYFLVSADFSTLVVVAELLLDKKLI